jgi:hypothetical protein
VLFGGGPATGPWQQLGTVAEITHPDAPSTARYSWANFWTDPEEENQPDELWDQIVREVTAQLVELGDPVDRPAFGGAPGSEPFNSFGGLQDIYVEDEVFTAQWSAIHETSTGAARTYFGYVIAFDGTIVARRERVTVTEQPGVTPQALAEEEAASIREWASSQGYGP